MKRCSKCCAENPPDAKFCSHCGFVLHSESISFPVRLLVVFANPIGTGLLRLGAEDRAIREALYHGTHQERIIIDVCHAANIHDVRQALLKAQYQIVQFSGHSDSSALLFEDQEGNTQFINLDVFASFLAAHSPPLECVILNACSTLEQGKLLAYDVPFVIAMRAPIGDRLAIEFSRGFYDAVAAGKDIEFAYQEGRRCVQLITNSQIDLPVLVRQSILHKYQRQPLGMRTAEYERWYAQLTTGKLEIRIDPNGANEINVLLAILDKVLKEKAFDKNTIDRTAIIVWELISNIARHVKNSFAIIGIEINKSYLPMVIVSVADQGSGFDLSSILKKQAINMKDGEPEHGLGRIRRFSNDVDQSMPSTSEPFHTIFCTLYSLYKPESIFDNFSWCATILAVYESPYCVWFSNSHHPMWAKYGVRETFIFALENDIPQLLDSYLGDLLQSKPEYICFEVQGSRDPTEISPGVTDVIAQVIQKIFYEFVQNGKVIILGRHSNSIHREFEQSIRDKIYVFSECEVDKCLKMLQSFERNNKH